MKRTRELTLEEFDSRPLEPITDDTNQLQGKKSILYVITARAGNINWFGLGNMKHNFYQPILFAWSYNNNFVILQINIDKFSTRSPSI